MCCHIFHKQSTLFISIKLLRIPNHKLDVVEELVSRHQEKGISNCNKDKKNRVL